MIQDDSTEISGWVLKAFGDCADLVRDSVNPTEEPPDLHYIGLEHIEEGALQLNGHGFAKEVESNKFHFRRGDILFGKLRPYFRKVVIAPFDGICSTDIWVVRAKKGIEQRYLFYWMASQQFIDDTTRASEGTKMPRAKWDFAARLERYIPPLPEQRTIACILGTLDDKIELNRRMNATLEAMAQAIFKSWFVDFDPVRAKVEGEEPVGMDAETVALFPDAFEEVDGQEVPEGWNVSTIGSVLELAYGKALKESDRHPGQIPVYGSNGQVGWHDEPLVKGPGIIIGRKGNPGTVAWSQTDFFPIDTTFYVVPKVRSMSLLYLYYELMFQNLPSQGSDSAVPGLNRNIAYMNSITIPSNEIIKRFDATIIPLFKLVHLNTMQSRTLAALRDTLLPKLISGEIRVPDAMLEVAEA